MMALNAALELLALQMDLSVGLVKLVQSKDAELIALVLFLAGLAP